MEKREAAMLGELIGHHSRRLFLMASTIGAGVSRENRIWQDESPKAASTPGPFRDRLSSPVSPLSTGSPRTGAQGVFLGSATPNRIVQPPSAPDRAMPSTILVLHP
jgi:hypothetical protein